MNLMLACWKQVQDGTRFAGQTKLGPQPVQGSSQPHVAGGEPGKGLCVVTGVEGLMGETGDSFPQSGAIHTLPRQCV